MILKLDKHDCNKKYIDLYISMTWPLNKNSHGICGHIFEIVDYYLFLKDRLNIKILIGEGMETDIFRNAISNKYDLSQVEIDDIINNTLFVDKPKYIIGDKILFVDGLLKTHFQEHGVALVFNKIYTFRCCKFCNHENILYDNVKVLQDIRVYEDDIDKSIDYVKKINFEKYKTINEPPARVALIYATKNCRYMSINEIQTIVDTYEYDKYLIVSDTEYDKLPTKCEILIPPVVDLFDKFTDYIYTPIEKRFDCSPRMIAECKYYNKRVIYHNIDDEYLQHDTGLRVRMQDIDNSIDLVTLQPTDTILDILSEH